MYGFIYINDSYIEEEDIMKSIGLDTFRLKWPNDNEELSDVNKNKKYIIRGPKVGYKEYVKLYKHLEMCGISPVSSPKAFQIANTAERNFEVLKEFSPNQITISNNTTMEKIYIELKESNLKVPIFIRSERESAAKYVGIDNCIVKNLTRNEVEEVIEYLKSSVRNFESIIFKEVIPILMNDNGERLEYRGIVLSGKLILFDNRNKLSQSIILDQRDDIEMLIKLASERGLDGGYFIDFGINEDRDFFVVECKDLMNGTIKDIKRMGMLLAEAK